VVWPLSVDSGLAADGTRQDQVAAAIHAAGPGTRVWLILSHDTGSKATAAEDMDHALTARFHHPCTYALPKSSGICTYDIWNFRGVTIHLYTPSGQVPVPPED